MKGTVLSSFLQFLPGASRNAWVYGGVVKFTGNSATVEVPSANVRLASVAQATFAGAPQASDGQISIDNADGNGAIRRDANGNFIVRRRVNGTTADANKMVVTDGAGGTLATWKAIANGSLNITVDDETVDVTAIDFSAAADMAGIASVLEDAINGALDGASVTVAYNSGTHKFTVTSDDDTFAGQVVQLQAVTPAAGTNLVAAGLLAPASAVSSAVVTLDQVATFLFIGY